MNPAAASFLASNFSEHPELYAAYGARGNAGDDIGLLVMRRSLDGDRCGMLDLAWVDKRHPLAYETVQLAKGEIDRWCKENNIRLLTAQMGRNSNAADALMLRLGFDQVARIYGRTIEEDE
jgi:hypothetical protein